ncbi:thaumatin family protein [Cryptococcus deuterogattii 99/473]|uniref:Thaumatin family protein n=1 Tax=Cryptococcus deuterogattii Ram5 TaxID=1296110 RepID=A0A0D0UWJ7_9TREE|nr:thaumatin family protein [Cryptococcus deuterogattii LA55]KIR39606.1 thaumatin family protein [Cryptococcus deuterogattii Ram5]KIR73942.1 thaumatin family protein [Cryptococcus deuterogattii CA1014]KIR93433.1 thaumatin family protein [Cryptococcus deuterogattii CBS 10090]KIY59236.1 thaumatin family protein [Cryptococcus deuterogattii 99/473]
MSPLLPSLLLALLIISSSFARQITVKNSCTSTIWPGLHTGEGTIPGQATGWELAAGGQTKFTVPDNWTAGRIWARTGCVDQDGIFQCLTGQCGSGENGDVTCKNSDQPPATLAEFTFVWGKEDNYDISLVDGFNIPLNIIPSVSSCAEPQCQVNINALCPPLLRTSLDQNGVNLGCIAPCNAGFGQEIYGNRACCTAGSNYVGAKEASHEYVYATARCSSIATTFSTTFNVGPSPTSTATIGKLDVVTTVAAGVDGAAAIQIGETGAASSDETKIAIPTTASQTAAGVVAQTISSSAVGRTSAAVLSSDGCDVSAVQATTAAEQDYTSVELFTVYGGSTLYKVIHGTAVSGPDATSTTGGTVALQVPHTDSAGVEGNANTEPGDDMPSSGHRWGEANWLSAVPTGAGDNSQKKRATRGA